MYSTSKIVSGCEDQIFGVLIRSMMYVPIINFNLEEGHVTPHGSCNLVLLQQILAIEFVRNKYGAMRGLFPVMVQMPFANFVIPLNLASAKSFLETLPDAVHQPTHEIALVLLDRIGIVVTKWTVKGVFTELLEEHQIPTSINIGTCTQRAICSCDDC